MFSQVKFSKCDRLNQYIPLKYEKISRAYKEHDGESSGTHLHNHWITMELQILLDVEK
jgi:hypothetical protein